MSIKWTLGAVAVVLAAFALPGIASADPGEITHTATTDCDDGSFLIALDFIGGSDGGDAYVEIEGNSYAETPPPAGMTASGDDNPEFVDGVSPNEWDFENFQVWEDFFTLSGDYDSVAALDGSVDVDYRLEWNGGNNVYQSGGVSVSSGLDGSWSECVQDYCVEGSNGVEQLSFQSTATNDCDPVRICLGGQSMTVTEHVRDQIDEEFTLGSCVPSEAPPPAPAAEAEPEEPVAEVEEAVEEAAPSVEEVAALPAAGSGTSAGGVAWAWLIGLTLLGVSGITTLVARRS